MIYWTLTRAKLHIQHFSSFSFLDYELIVACLTQVLTDGISSTSLGGTYRYRVGARNENYVHTRSALTCICPFCCRIWSDGGTFMKGLFQLDACTDSSCSGRDCRFQSISCNWLMKQLSKFSVSFSIQFWSYTYVRSRFGEGVYDFSSSQFLLIVVLLLTTRPRKRGTFHTLPFHNVSQWNHPTETETSMWTWTEHLEPHKTLHNLSRCPKHIKADFIIKNMNQ